jgi:hypothetical protein
MVVATWLAFLLPAHAEECAANPAWLHPAGDLKLPGKPLPHPTSDCPFYQASWQTFLYVTNPDASGLPSFLNYPTIESTFGSTTANLFPRKEFGRLSLAPRVRKEGGDVKVSAGTVQAGELQGVLIDQAGNPIYYAIHMNEVFTKFLTDSKIIDAQTAKDADPTFRFPTGTVELKSAWKIVDPASPPPDYYTVKAIVPIMKKVGGEIVVDKAAKPRQVTVALVAIHVVFVLEGHPEFVWSTFEHVDASGNPDSAPAAAHPRPSLDQPVSTRDFLLYKAGTKYEEANQASSKEDRLASFDEVSQKFKPAPSIPSSIYRLFPYSKANTSRPDGTVVEADQPDDAVVAVNGSMAKLFDADTAGATADKRKFYRLVGAVWLDNPIGTPKKPGTFTVKQSFFNKPTESSDTDGAMLAGEDALSSTAMESFTQDQFVNCFACHNTRVIKSDRQGHPVLMTEKLINVSHILSKFLLDTQ